MIHSHRLCSPNRTPRIEGIIMGPLGPLGPRVLRGPWVPRGPWVLWGPWVPRGPGPWSHPGLHGAPHWAPWAPNPGTPMGPHGSPWGPHLMKMNEKWWKKIYLCFDFSFLFWGSFPYKILGTKQMRNRHIYIYIHIWRLPFSWFAQQRPRDKSAIS